MACTQQKKNKHARFNKGQKAYRIRITIESNSYKRINE